MNNKNKLIRCVNIDTNQVRFFPIDFCYNQWWQKNTRFIPQEIPAIESTIINSNNTTLEMASTIANNEIVDAVSDVEVKTKRKYKKRKSNGIN